MADSQYDWRELLAGVLRDDPNLGFEVTDGMIAVAETLGARYGLFRQIFWAYRQRQDMIENNPRIGAKITVRFDHAGQKVAFERLGRSFELTVPEFLVFMGKVDACCAPIYPLGTVVELDMSVMPESVREVFGGEKPGLPMLMVLTGRKIPLMEGFDKYVIDYYARFWPFGELPEQDPVAVAGVMIRRAVFEGLCTPDEEAFAFRVLRLSQLAVGQFSSVFMPDGVNGEYVARVRELVREGAR